MATKLKEMPARKGRATLHPWQEWTDGSVWKIKQGEDFSGKLEPMRVRLYSKANELDKRLEILVDREDNSITFQMIDMTPEEIAQAKAAAEARAAKRAEAKAAAEAEED